MIEAFFYNYLIFKDKRKETKKEPAV